LKINQFNEISDVLPLEVLLKIFGYLNLMELVELSKVNSYYRKLAKIVYIEKVIKSKLIMEINLGTEQPINIRYECTRFNRKTEQTVWKPTAIIGTKNKRSVNTKEKVILRRIYFEKEPHMSEYYNLVHEVKGEMDIKDSGIECIKGEESLHELYKKNKKLRKDKKRLNNSMNKQKKQKIVNNVNSQSTPNDNFSNQKNDMIQTELSSNNSIKSRNSICSDNSIISSNKENKNGLMLNNQCLFFLDDDVLVKDTIKWSFEYKVESITKPTGDSWQKLQPSKLRLPLDLFLQNKPEEIPSSKKHNYSKYKSIVKKNLLSILERFSNSFVGVV